MPSDDANYFTVLQSPKDIDLWGVAVTGVGYHRTLPEEAYPTPQHPPEHSVEWGRGQVLECLKLVLISSGRGELETRETGLRAIYGGHAFVLLPGMWHRFRPDPETGWEESWVELRGPTVKQLIERQMITPRDPIHRVSMAGRIETTMKSIHGLARVAVSSNPDLSALGVKILAHWVTKRSSGPENSRVTLAIQRAERILTDAGSTKISIPEVAREVGMAYSHFRREFKARIGRTPVEYLVRVRLRRACRLLLATDATLDEIAETIGFSSGFHLSTQFKKTFGSSPKHWKAQIKNQAAAQD